MASVRINLSVPARLDGVVTRVAKVTGRTKAAVVMEAVAWMLPRWERHLLDVDGAGAQPALAALAVPGSDVQPAAVAAAGVDVQPGLTRQQRRAMQRSMAKGRGA